MSKTYRRYGIDEEYIEGQPKRGNKKKTTWYIRRRKIGKEKRKIKEIELDNPLIFI